ncbi:MAG: protein kinase [Ardenticatenaceae bacterium]|nr:protein kinase [Ardenticatenaceae bacterium]
MTDTNMGRYQIIRQLGQGGMGTVYVAYDPRFEREVALKVLPPGFLQEADFRQRFEREAKIIAHLEHNAIVPVYDYGEENARPYIVMRLMNGGSLQDRLAQGPLPLEQVITITQRIASALDKAHANNIVHRDLKPANILFDSDGAAYLADFGIARLAEGTQTVTIIGTPQYMAPEQAHGYPLDARTDVYQLGVVLFQMLTGAIPFDAPTPAALLHQHAYAPIPSVTTLNRTLSPACDQVIQKAMSKEKGDRYATAGLLSAALEQAITTGAVLAGKPTVVLPETPAGVTPPPTMPPPTTPPPTTPAPIPAGTPKRATGRWLAILAGLLLLLIICAGGSALAYGQIRDRFFVASVATPTPVSDQGQIAALTATAGAPTADTTTDNAAGETGSGDTPSGTADQPAPAATNTRRATATRPGTATSAPPTNAPAVLPSSTPTRQPTNTPTRPPTSTATPTIPPPPTNTPTPTIPPPPTNTPTIPPPVVPLDSVYGVITHLGSPVPNVTVALNTSCAAAGARSTLTNAQGEFSFGGVTPGTYYLMFNGWNGTGPQVTPYDQSCTWDLLKIDGSPLRQDWDLNKTDLQITFPGSESSINTTTPTFTWNPYPGAAYYEVVLSQTSPSFISIEFLTPAGSGTSFTSATPLVSGGRYQFVVWAYTAGGAQFAFGQIYFNVN